jgi:hypothetical protein
MEIDEIKKYYIEEWKFRFEELNELTKFLHSLDD